jgi:hypothetical protein
MLKRGNSFGWSGPLPKRRFLPSRTEQRHVAYDIQLESGMSLSAGQQFRRYVQHAVIADFQNIHSKTSF